MTRPLRFHHVGLACPSLSAEREAHLMLGFREEGPEFEDPVQRIRGQFLVQDGYRVELLEPSAKGSPLDGYLKRGIKMYHQAFEAHDLRAAIDSTVAGGAMLLVKPVPAVAFGGREIAFMALRTGLIVEFIQAIQ